MTDLVISPDLSLPPEAVTQTFGILGQRGAGKSTTAVVMAEEMWKAKLPWVAIDPKGDWHGIRSSSNGKGPGLALPVFGGLHGDVPLEVGAGRLVADLLVEKMLTAVVDVSDFSKGDRARFLVDFFDRLYRRHRADPHARHVFLEEAHEYIPQQVTRTTAQLKDSASRIVLQGRSFGLGSSACSQRSARLHKDTLTQIDTLVAMRTTGPQDRDAIMGWVSEHALGKELVASLPGLDNGEAWFWSPHFLQITKRIRLRQRETFDSGATPGVGMTRREPAILADVDLATIKEQMSETIERAKADDPRELRRRITSLEAELRTSRNAKRETEIVTEVEYVTKIERVPVFDDRLWTVLGPAVDMIPRVLAEVQESLAKALEKAEGLEEIDVSGREDIPGKGRAGNGGDPVGELGGSERPVPDLPVQRWGSKPSDQQERSPQRDDPAPRRQSRSEAVSGAAEGLGKAPLAILTAVASVDAGMPLRRAAMLAGYSPRKSTVRNALSTLRVRGLVTSEGQMLRATHDGLSLVLHAPALPTGPALYDYWMSELGAAEREMLRLAVEVYPYVVNNDHIATKTEYDPAKSTVRNAFSKLRTLGLIEGKTATVEFMESIGRG